MAGTITHKWNGTILTITSDSGTSSMDLKGSQGNTGPRGPQGAAGVVTGGGSGSVDLTGYATEAYVDSAVAAVEYDMSNYYTKSQTDSAIQDAVANIEVGDIDLSDYYTKSEVDAKDYATETFVTNKIAEAQLGGEGGEIDLTGYATKDDLNTYRKLDNNNFTGDLVVSGAGWFTELYTGEQGNRKLVATREWVNTAITDAIAALDGSEVEY